MKKLFTLAVAFLLATTATIAQNLKFNADGKFKIAQFTDIHYNGSKASKAALKVLENVLTQERPDLIVLSGDIIYGRRYILLTEAKKIAVDDAGCTEKVTFTEEELVDGGIKTPYYLLVFADNKTQWTYRINAVSGDILEKKEKNIGEADLISLE